MPLLITRMTRALVGLAVAAGLAVVVAAPPAQATNASCTSSPRWVASHATWGVPSRMRVTYGEHFSFSAQLDTHCVGNTDPVQGTIWAGDTRFQVSADRGRTWRTVDSEPSYLVRWEGTWSIKRAVWMRVHTTGGRSYANDTWAPSTSSVVKLTVARKATVRVSGARVKVAVAPAKSIRGLRVAVQVERQGTWRTVQRPRVSRRGVAVARLPRASQGAPVRVVLPAARGLARSVVRP
ncbi:hypothetical protein [Pimelobacter simplex]|uniref:hypothetical protein n=1 Tax=Nocardioides simplex TaxID=2045 RepID=UPI003AB03E2A